MPTLEEIAAEQDDLDTPEATVEAAKAITGDPSAAPDAYKSVSGQIAGQVGNAVITRMGRVAAKMWNEVEAAQQRTSPYPKGRSPLGEVGVNDAGQTTIGSTDQLFDPKKHVMLRDDTGRVIAYPRTPDTDEDRLSSFAQLLKTGMMGGDLSQMRRLTQGKPPVASPPSQPRLPSPGPQAMMQSQDTANLGMGGAALGNQMMQNRNKYRPEME